MARAGFGLGQRGRFGVRAERRAYDAKPSHRNDAGSSDRDPIGSVPISGISSPLDLDSPSQMYPGERAHKTLADNRLSAPRYRRFLGRDVSSWKSALWDDPAPISRVKSI
jgi:hypothetical protein